MAGRRWVAVTALVIACAGTVWGGGVEIDGTAEMGADLLPTFSTFVDLDMTISGETWEVESEAEISVTPSFGGSLGLEAEMDLDFVELKLEAEVDLDPFELESVDAYAAVDLFRWEIRKDDPEMRLSSNFLIGAVFEDGVDPYAGLKTRLHYADHKLTNTTTVSLINLDVASELEADLDFGRFELGEIGVAVKVYGDVSTDLIPFDFSRARLNVKLLMGDWSILNRVTYRGGDSFVGKIKVELNLGKADVAAWASYSTTSSTPFDLGVSASVVWSLID